MSEMVERAAEWRPSHFSPQPSSDTDQWYVWDIYAGVPPKPVFFGTMEEAGGVADVLNARRIQRRAAAGDFDGF